MRKMSQQLVALTVLMASSGVAHTASSVTLYGRIDVAYDYNDDFGLRQMSKGDLRLGIKGSEDLGNGLSATFRLEGRFDADTGAKSEGRSLFDRESTVGLKGAFGHVRLGRSISALEQGISFTDVGRRNTGMIQNYASSTRHSNGLFYNYKTKTGAFEFGADVTTKGSYNEGQGLIPSTADGIRGKSLAYGAFAKYKAHGFELGAAYQADQNKTVGKANHEWGVAAAYTLSRVTFGGSYAYAMGEGAIYKGQTYHGLGVNGQMVSYTMPDVGSRHKVRTITAFTSIEASENDVINIIYNRILTNNDKNLMNTGVTLYGVGYIHSLSKRTSLYADVARYSLTGKKSVMGYDIAMRHTF